MTEDKNINATVEGLIEDIELAREYGDHIREVEGGNSKMYYIENLEDVFNLL